MGVISWIVLGVVAGVFAELVVRERFPGGAAGAVVVAVAGAFLGGAAFSLLANRSGAGFDPSTLPVALGAASALLAAVHRADRAEPRRARADRKSRAAEP